MNKYNATAYQTVNMIHDFTVNFFDIIERFNKFELLNKNVVSLFEVKNAGVTVNIRVERNEDKLTFSVSGLDTLPDTYWEGMRTIEVMCNPQQFPSCLQAAGVLHIHFDQMFKKVLTTENQELFFQFLMANVGILQRPQTKNFRQRLLRETVLGRFHFSPDCEIEYITRRSLSGITRSWYVVTSQDLMGRLHTHKFTRNEIENLVNRHVQ